MTKTKAKQRVVWAIDPFEEKCGTRSHILESLKELSERGAYIEPVYVLSPDEYDIDVEFNAPWLKQLRPTIEKVLDQCMKNYPVKGLARPQVIIEKRPSFTRAVKTLISYAERTKADTILVGTHAKQGISRFFLGSFAETLLLYSKVPVLVVGPHSEIPQQQFKSDRILFSTDFGASSLPTFKKVVALAKARHAKITLFHCLPHPIEPFFQSGVFLLGGGYLAFPDYLKLDEERKRKAGQRYISAAKKLGVDVEIRFYDEQTSAASAIVEEAQREKSRLIAMAAESGAISAALIGSITRQVVRSAPCPVWVLRAS